MELLTRRDFLSETLEKGYGLLATPTFLSPLNLADLAASIDDKINYGFVTDKLLPAWPEAGVKDHKVSNYQKNALLRFRATPETPHGWAQIVNDSYLHDQSKPLAHGDIFIESSRLKILNPKDLTPIHSEIPADRKRIDVSLTVPQTLTAYEDNVPFLTTVITAGLHNMTPTGEFIVLWTRLARYMQGTDPDFDLPGVPWVAYFTWRGHAFHGTYWRDSFGRPGSHGCLNIPMETANRLWRWGGVPGVRLTIHP